MRTIESAYNGHIFESERLCQTKSSTTAAESRLKVDVSVDVHVCLPKEARPLRQCYPVVERR